MTILDLIELAILALPSYLLFHVLRKTETQLGTKHLTKLIAATAVFFAVVGLITMLHQDLVSEHFIIH